MRVAIDVGGTYTDAICWHQGDVHLVKTPTTPEHPVEGVLHALRLLHKEVDNGARVEQLTHGTTLATNLLVEGKGARVAMITTRGFRDVLALGRQKRDQLYALAPTQTEPLVKRRHRYEVPERTLFNGSIVEPLDLTAMEDILEELAHTDCQSIALCFLHAYASPMNEQRAAEIIQQRYPQWAVSLSSEVAPYFREYERFSTTVMNAYLKPVIGQYFTNLGKVLGRYQYPQPYIMKSDGGVMSLPVARERAVDTLLSGPAGGVMGAAFVGQQSGRSHLITLDIGGTTTDASLVVEGKPLINHERRLAGHALQIPMLAIHTIGAGGGSVARISPSGLLKVGPDSAGAVPGPVCYDLGGRDATVTDAHLLLDHIPVLRPGTYKLLNRALTTHTVEELGRALNMTAIDMAAGIVEVANHTIAEAVRLISIQRGYDSRDFTLVAGGGGGGLHAAAVAKILSITEVLIPREASGLSALGLLLADMSQEFILTRTAVVDELIWDDVEQMVDALHRRARDFFEAEQIPETQRTIQWSVDMRYRGQAYEVTVSLPPLTAGSYQQQLTEKFHAMHRQLYGHANRTQPVQVTAWRVLAIGCNPLRTEVRRRHMVHPDARFKTLRPMSIRRGIPVWDWDRLAPGVTIDGPAFVDGLGTSIVIPSEVQGRVDESGTIGLILPAS